MGAVDAEVLRALYRTNASGDAQVRRQTLAQRLGEPPLATWAEMHRLGALQDVLDDPQVDPQGLLDRVLAHLGTPEAQAARASRSPQQARRALDAAWGPAPAR